MSEHIRIDMLRDSLHKRILQHNIPVTLVARWVKYHSTHISKVFRREAKASENLLNAIDSALNKYDEFINSLEP